MRRSSEHGARDLPSTPAAEAAGNHKTRRTQEPTARPPARTPARTHSTTAPHHKRHTHRPGRPRLKELISSKGSFLLPSLYHSFRSPYQSTTLKGQARHICIIKSMNALISSTWLLLLPLLLGWVTRVPSALTTVRTPTLPGRTRSIHPPSRARLFARAARLCLSLTRQSWRDHPAA